MIQINNNLIYFEILKNIFLTVIALKQTGVYKYKATYVY